MLAIKVNNAFLDLPADMSLELERNNPFLSEDIQGEFSLGLTLKYSEKNYSLLQYIGNFYKKNIKYTLDAQLYDNGSFRYAGKLVITQHQTNMNNVESTVWTGFFTIGAASFQQEIENVLLQDIDLGGDRTFNWTTFDADDRTNGFFQHVHAARIPNAFPYTFYPIFNDDWFGDIGVSAAKFMNSLATDGTNHFFGESLPLSATQLYGNYGSFCPAIYLSFLLDKIFQNYGWQLSGEVVNDIGYQKLTIPSFQAIKWVDYSNILIAEYFSPMPVIIFDLADHVPQDLTVGALLINIKNRLGWYFDFDSNTKTAYLRANKNLVGTPVKDWTNFVLADYAAEYTDPEKVYSLVNNIDSADTYPLVKIIDESAIAGRVSSFSTLPAASITYSGLIYFAFFENNYYVCEYNATSTLYEWNIYSNNVGDYVPAGSKDAIESEISTMPVALRGIITGGAKALVPVCHQVGNYWQSVVGYQPFGIRFLFYHGMYPDTTGIKYPYASCHNLAISGTPPTGSWSLPYRHQYAFTNDGSYDYWWQKWLALLGIQDTRTFTLQLPVTELKKFTFNDTIFINNVYFLVKSVKEVLPYKGMVEMKMKRIY